MAQRPKQRDFARSLVSFVSICVFGAVAGCHRAAPPRPSLAALSIARDAARFAVTAANDSTVSFKQAEVRWFRPGLRGYVVDPMQRDALVARVTVKRLDSITTIANIDGAVGPVALTHLVLFEQPATAWWRAKRFWLGAGIGAVAGAAGATIAK